MSNALRSTLCAVLLGAIAFVSGCATTAPRTSLEASWVAPQLPQTPFKKLLIITVASDEFVQIAFQDQMAALLKGRGVNAVASHRYFIHYTDAERERFRRSIVDSGADAVMLARVASIDQESRQSTGVIIGANGVPYVDATGIYGAYAGYFSATSLPANDYVVRTVISEASIYADKGAKLIWSARTRTTNAQSAKSGAAAATQFIDVIVEAMKKDKLL